MKDLFPVLHFGRIQRSFQSFFQSSAFGGILLMICTMCALYCANSFVAPHYFALLTTPIDIRFGAIGEHFSLLHFINDGIMVIFFFVVGAEIKREIVVGELSDVRKAMLPIVSAVFGMAVPGMLFAMINLHEPTLHGWAIPSATDIAFSLGILALLGDRIPASAKVFLAALAIADDLGAVMVIALFYSQGFSLTYLLMALPIIGLLLYCNRKDVQSPLPYTILGILLWYCIHHSGIHATVAGVILAFTVPISAPLRREEFIVETQAILNTMQTCATDDESFEQDIVRALESACDRVQPPLMQFLHALEPYNAYLIVPVFAIVNAGVALQDNLFTALQTPVSMGIIAGLCIGKPLGIMTAVWLMGLAGVKLPYGMRRLTMLGVSCLCGVGFTMSLFVGGLSFTDASILAQMKIAVLCASLLSGIVGYILLIVDYRHTHRR
jgi:NhaA family Na+:H+ antiporter